MMNIKLLFYWLYERGKNYNLFMLEEHEYHDDEEHERQNPEIVVKRQKYTTWLYVFLFIVSFYQLFYATLMTSHSQTVTVYNITPTILEKLYIDHSDKLSCPCSTITIPYMKFVSNNISFHPVCSSIFISEQWIKALYFINGSRYGVTDFRTTARSQFQLLSDLCSISQETISQNVIDFNNNEFLTIHLLPQIQIQSVINATINVLKNSASTQITSFLNYLRIYIRANYFVSALNTNLMLSTYLTNGQYPIYQVQTQYTEDTTRGSWNTQSMLCGTANPILPAGFFSNINTTAVYTWSAWFKPTANTPLVNGFFGGCTPLEAILSSTLDCLYDIECIKLLVDYFPGLNQLNINWNDSILHSKEENNTVYDNFLNLFIEEWSTILNYSKYFSECIPSSCSYTITYPVNLTYTITLLISLYGGLIIILRLISPFVIKILLKLKNYSHKTTIDNVPQNVWPSKIVKSVQQLNVFKNVKERSEKHVKQQKIITRIYIILLIGSFIVLLIFNSLSTDLSTITVSNPSLSTYKNLQILYGNTLRCPCSTPTISYKSLLSISPILHQVCSSDFVTDRWLSIMGNISDWTFQDWRNIAYPQFNLLTKLCQLANNTINYSIYQFLLQSFITSNILSQLEYNTQLNATLNQFFQSTINSFTSLIDVSHLITQVDQPYMGSITTQWMTTADTNLIPNITINNITNQQILQVMFQLPGTRYVNLSAVNCICATNSYCQSPVAIYQMDYVWNSRIRADIDYIVPGSIAGCSNLDTLLFSQLLCFYSSSNCFQILMNYIKESYYQNVEFPTWFNARPLLYDPTISRYPPNTSLSIIVKEMMIEKWNPSYSYDNFYQLCAPTYCTYSENIRRNSVISVIIILVSMLGGLTVSLRLLTPWIVKYISKLLARINERKQQNQETVPINKFNQFKTITKNLVSSGYNTVINLNIFSVRDFGSHIDRTTVKCLGKWATRLHISLFIIGLGILTLYSIVQPQTLTENFDKPSFYLYNRLKNQHKDNLKCSCSVIASKYKQFLQINADFHQICTSPFISDEWRMNITSRFASNQSIYEQNDYRRFISSHLQYLQGLCQYSIQSVNNSIEQFLNSLFITLDLLSENDFYSRLDLLIQQRKVSAPKAFTELLFLIRSINHGNAFVSTYGTNFQYISPWFWTDTYYPYVPSEAIIYDNQCSCGLQSNCTTQANFILRKSSQKIPIKGFKIGCTPTESLRVSTLECFYNQSCINLIEQYTNSINQINSNIIPLSIRMSRFLINTTVAELIDNLFVEQWITSINYSLYYEQCLPLLCSYSYIQHFNILYIITLLLGLQGGLTIVLQWISPKLVQIITKINANRKKRTNIINSEHSSTTKTTEIDNINIKKSLDSITIVSINTTPTKPNICSSYRSLIKLILTCLIILSIIIGLILFSIYVSRLRTNEIILTTSATTMILNITNTTTISITTTTITTTTTHTPLCQLKFQVTARYRSGSTAGLKSPVAADFNNDKLLDIAFFNYGTNSFHVLIGDGKGNYTAELQTLVESYTTWAFIIDAADLNHDNNIDLVFTSENRNYVYFIFGNGNGTFRSLSTFYMGNPVRTRGIGIYDFNNDTHLDLALASQSENIVFILFGNGDGTFSNQTAYYAGPNTNPSSLMLADINNDGYQDIIYNNIMSRSVGVLLGYGNGTFQKQIKSFVGGYYYPSFIAVGDFNGDHRTDVAVSYSAGNSIGVLLGHGNGTMGPITKYLTGNRTYYARITTGDLNNDGYSDIVVNPILPSDIYILVSYGNGNFDLQKIFSTELNTLYSWMNVADFNRDGCQDILASDDTNGAVFILLNTCQCQLNQTVKTSTTMYH